MAVDPAFGTALRRLRSDARLSLQQLAELSNVDKSHLSRLENHRRAPGPQIAKTLDDVLGAGGELLRPAQDPHPTPSRASTPTWTVAFDPDGSGRLHVHDDDPAVVRWPRPGIADLHTADLLLNQLATLTEMGRWHGPATVLPSLVSAGRTAQAMIGDMPRMASVAARFAEFAGWMAQELGDDQGARWCTLHAAELAAAAGDDDLTAYTHVRLALISLYQSDAHRTVEHAVLAGADRRAGPRVRWLAALREAQGHALGGDDRGFQRALDRAREWGERTTDHHRTPPLGSGTAADLTLVTEGWGLYDLGRYTEAASTLEAGISRVGGLTNRSAVRFRLRQALACAAADDIDRSCDLVDGLLPAIIRLDSATIRADLAAYARVVRRRSREPSVRAIQPGLVAALHRHHGRAA
ncbi:transcriptional regulator with XRE-family HTH domain [Actinoplanes campanulatus]|uniref:Transcriptional regulator with XRE-family HTH domain n=1 Tax=Actinoplanes campanulatus TaxID=113559 RepID=A0A7W5FF92_9ACTN|nr:helix-turn-helix transcriptional regulator [Actinoplanes campanulatus]MBB3096130.1 transcriptional regulator with XRE-family HTH domain [Actinoplanes campanulatus]GGN13940.1 hypothetical protein GCM10010109_25140 [Actinoplanes campanulatus]GID36776.1 hypothetical protein Aca09nite_32820 [Actinoplanes campanulatus]